MQIISLEVKELKECKKRYMQISKNLDSKRLNFQIR